MLIPILVVILCNTMIIGKTRKNDLKRNLLRNRSNRPQMPMMKKPLTRKNCKLKPFYLTMSQRTRKINKPENRSKQMSNILCLISFSYAFLNLPYLIVWMLFFYNIAFNNENIELQNYLFGALQLFEIFYVLNYSLKFYVFCLTGSLFRNYLKFSSKPVLI
jgi:hypothetical protein